MKIIHAISAADALSPNQFTFNEKIHWCDEVSLALRRDIKKYYSVIETLVTCPEEFELPDDISIDDVEAAYVAGKLIDKADLRSLPHLCGSLSSVFSGSVPKILKLVYLTKPDSIRNIELKGTYKLSENVIFGSELPLFDGDNIECVLLENSDDEPDWDVCLNSYVYQNDGESVYLTDDIFTPQTEAHLAIRRVIDDETEADPPYDRLYIEYIMAKMALYQHDYDTYSAHMTQYNNLYSEYKKDYKTRNPLNDLARFKNFW